MQSTVFGIPQVINYAKDEYNAGTQNWSVIQDESGMMVFGNNKGALFFDGTHWDLLPMPNRTVVRSVAKGLDGRIFIGGQDEFGWLSKNAQAQIEYHSFTDRLAVEDRSFEDVWKIFPTEERVFFCTQKALFVYEDDTFLVVKSPQRFQNFFFVNDQLYAQERGKGLVRWEEGRFVLLPGGEQFNDFRIASILPQGKDLLIISDFSGLYRFSGNRITPWQTEVSSFLQKNQAYCALLLPNKDIAIGTAQDGLVIIDQEGKALLHLNKDTGLQNNTILAITQDRLNNYWLALDNGIDYVEISMPFARIADEIGLEGTGYAAELYEGKLYLGTNQGLFSIDWPLPYKSTRRNQVSKVGGVKGQIWGLNRLGSSLIINSHAGTFQLEKGKIAAISPPQGAWKIMRLNGTSSLAIEGGYTGLYLYENTGSEENPTWRFKHRIDGFDESARVIEQDQAGNIWVSHAYKGLFKIRLKDDYQIAEVRYFGEQDGLPGTIGINVLKIGEEVLFTTLEGVYSYNQESDRFEPYESFNKILGGKKEIHRLLQDEEEKLWFSMGKEFGCLNIQEKGFLERPGIDHLFFNHLQEELVDGFEEIYAIDKDNTIIATENGFVSYSPQRGAQRDLHLNVLLRQVRTISGADSLLYSDGLLLPSNATAQEVQELAIHLNALHFSYAAPFYEQIDQLNYRYWLKGYEDEWSSWSSRTEKEFTNLASGDYEFQVQAQNTYGTISEAVVYRFTILPPWYASTLAKTVYFLLGLLALGGAFVYFSKKIEKERQAFEANQAKTLAEKEAEFQQEKEKSEEEIDRLRSENLQSDIQHRTSQLASATMHLVQKGEVLLKIKKELAKVHKQVSTEENRKKLQKIIHTIDGNIRLDSNWEQFEAYFDQVHENFLRNLREAYPDLTPKDQKLCAYLRMNLTTKEIAPLMNISVRGVEISRYRLRKKLDLDTNTNLTDFIMRF
ncbi:triple tyrosine motif-containing protein [Lewinella sp. LCG006]|uniref:helix-turn-helix and ligand-binding sensor domain-containing protein n=1 Tax=Lewinella sp. LCG006 TaxID=3231911 RepID=UPI0034601789